MLTNPHDAMIDKSNSLMVRNTAIELPAICLK